MYSHEGFAGDFKKIQKSAWIKILLACLATKTAGSIDQVLSQWPLMKDFQWRKLKFLLHIRSENQRFAKHISLQIKRRHALYQIDGKAEENNLPVHYELHFKRKGSTTQKDLFNWRMANHRLQPALERSLAFKILAMMIRLSSWSIRKGAWKDLNNRWTLQIHLLNSTSHASQQMVWEVLIT